LESLDGNAQKFRCLAYADSVFHEANNTLFSTYCKTRICSYA